MFRLSIDKHGRTLGAFGTVDFGCFGGSLNTFSLISHYVRVGEMHAAFFIVGMTSKA